MAVGEMTDSCQSQVELFVAVLVAVRAIDLHLSAGADVISDHAMRDNFDS